MDFKRGIRTGLGAAVVLIVLSMVLGVLMPSNMDWYMQTFPSMSLASMIFAQALIGLLMGIIYTVLSPSIPGEGIGKGVNYGLIVYLFAGVMWPVMASSFAPLSVWLGDLIKNLLLYTVAGAVVEKIS